MLACTLRTEPVLGSPFTLRVLPADTCGRECIATGNHLNLGDVEATHSIMVETRDNHGNPRGVGGDWVEAWIEGPGTTGGRHECHTRDCEDGWYEVTYKINTIGRYKLHLSVNTEPLAQSPEKLTITS